jgi:hypothetical protein
MDPSGQTIWNTLSGFCKDCTVVQGTTYLANADGSRADLKSGAYLHHSIIRVVSRSERPFFACAKGNAPAKKPWTSSSFFLASGVDASDFYFTLKNRTYNSGYYLPADSQFQVQTEAINFNIEPKEWYIAVEIEYVPGKPADLELSTVVDLNVNTCEAFSPSSSVYQAPKGVNPFNMTSPKFIVDRDLVLLQASKINNL